MLPPRVQLIVNRKAGQHLQTGFHGIAGQAIEGGITQHLACHDHGTLLDQVDLMLLLHHLPPGIDLLVNVIFTGQTLVQLPLKVDENGSSL